MICAAALEEMAEVGYGAMSMESIAKRAGVGKATIYRHWSGKLDLVESALQLMNPDAPVPDTGTARDKVTAMLRSLVDYLDTWPARGCLPAIVSASHYDAGVRAVHLQYSRERRQAFVAVLQAGIEHGELDGDLVPDHAIDQLVGPVFYRRLMTDRPVSVDEIDRLVTAALGRDRRRARVRSRSA